jgi:hypothetical protein
MKKRFTFLLAALLLMSGLTWAQTAINWIASEQGYTNAQVIESVSFDNNVSGTFNKGTNSNAPKYYDTGAAIRCYGGNYFTITSDYDLTQISLDFASGGGTNAITTNTGTYENGIWTGNATEVTFTIGGSSGHRRIASFEITYSTGGNPICATPTFSPAGGTYTEAQNVEIYCNTEGATIYYTLDGSDPTTSSLDYSSAIAIEETTTIKAIAVADNHNNSNVATATYTIISFDHEGTEADPYSVADAHTAIDAGTGTQGVYATGIVSEIVTEYSTQYSNVTFDIVDEEGNEVYLRAYRCGGEEAANVAVGDVVVVSGDLTKYGATYEFAQGCQVVSLEHPAVVVEAPIFSPEAGTYDEAQTVAISTATEGADIYYTLDGTEPTMSSAMYETPLQISETTTIKAIAVDGDDNASTVATATYHICSANSPYTVTQALNFIEYPTSTIWVHGIVSTAPTSAPNSNGQLTYYISDNGEATDQLQVYKGKGLNEASFTAQDDIQVGDIVTITGIVKIYNNTKEFDAGNYLVSFERPQSTVPSITVEPDAVSVDANEHDGTLNLAYENLTITDMTDFDIQYYDAQGQELNGDDVPGWIEVSVAEQDHQVGEGYVVSYYMVENEGEARSAYFKVYAMDDETNLVYSNLVTINQAEYVAPVASITVDPTTVNVPAEGAEGTLTVTYEHITEVAAEVWFCDAAGTTEVTYDWITADINNDNNVEYLIESNDGEARTAYFKVYALDNNANDVYSDLVTINQAEYVAPAVDYATLPFNWGGGTAEELLAVQGVTANGLGSNYAASNAPYRVKFDGTGDYIQVKTDTNPDYVIVNVKMLGGSNTSSITVQASADGETFDEGEALTISGAQNDILELISTRSFDESVRYIRLYFTKGSNVGVGPITIAKYESYPLAITGYGDSEGGYVLLASPVYAKPANTGMITDDVNNVLTYDFYYFDQSQELEWINYREHPFNIVPGKGYLYANKIDVDLTFTGVPYSGDGQIALTYDANAEFAGWNLVGNPFGNAATIDKAYYKLKEDGSDVNPETENSAIDVMEGVFVVAETNGETVTFTEQTTPNNDSEIAQMNINVSKSRGESVDRAIVRFDNGNQLPKFQLNPNHTKVYIPQGNNDYAIVRSDAQGEMPVNFKAQSNGTYTISIDAKNVEMSYLHLIDNMTGADIDLLATPSYTFEANTNDYSSRFRMVFSANNVNDDTTSETFAYFNGSEWSISNTGRATLQVVDVLGRIVSSESVNGNTTLSTTNLKDGVYMFRLVNGENVKVQKVVVK